MRLVVINGQPYLSIESTKDLVQVARYISGSQIVDETCKVPADKEVPSLFHKKRRPSRINRTTVICPNPSCGLPCVAHGFKKHKRWCDTLSEAERQAHFARKMGR